MKKVPKEKLGTCILCDDPIYPGDFIGITTKGSFVHAGFHWTMKERDAICETAAIGSAFWTKEGIPQSIGPTGIEVAMQTGKTVISEVGPHGIQHTVISK